MAIHLPWRDLVHRRARTTAALAGVIVAVVLLYMQLGFYLACRTSSTRVLDLFHFDLAITSARYTYTLESHRFQDALVHKAAALPAVDGVTPVSIGPGTWRNPQSGRSYDLLAVGVDPDKTRFRNPEAQGRLAELKALDTVLFDRHANPILGENPVGTVSELDGRRLTVAGQYTWGAGFIAQGIGLTSRSTFRRVFEHAQRRDIQLGLIRLRPGADAHATLGELRRRMPENVRVWTRDQLRAQDRRFFMSDRPIGLMFTSGVLVALLVGAVILYQVLASEVTSRRSELATLQALGFTRARVRRLIIEQGMLYALLAFIPATAAAMALFHGVRRLTRLPLELTPGLALAVLVLSLLMCVLGAEPAGRRVRHTDPAELF